jgi:RNA polymerase sigma-70 factor (ECF subfamily)
MLYERYSRLMLGICLRYVGDRETARDLLQEGFIKVFGSLSGYAGSGSLVGWLRAIFVNVCLEYLRRGDVLRNAVELDDTVELSSAEVGVLSEITADELMELVRSLPEGFRVVFNLYAIEGYSHREIAAKLGITESTSRSQYARARRWLQERLSGVAELADGSLSLPKRPRSMTEATGMNEV